MAYLSAIVALVVFAFQHSLGWELLFVWIIPGFMTHTFLSFTLDFLTHYPHNEKERYRQTRLISGPGLKVLLLGQDMHIVHHLYPSIPFYRYGAVYKEIKSTLEKNNYRSAKLY